MDFVILWVDDKDSEWREEYGKYSLLEEGEKRVCRFRDWDNLHYWFRGVEKFAPWVDQVFFITAGQVPSWMNVNHPKLKIIFHEEYIPKDILPTFNSNTIEMFLHQIPGLSEQFVLFNDDFFIINKIKPEHFFVRNMPVDICALNVFDTRDGYLSPIRNIDIINKHFDKSKSFKNDYFKWFSTNNGKHLVRTLLLCWWPHFVGFYDHHLPQPFLKSTFQEIWSKEKSTLLDSVRLKFRQKNNLTQYLFRYWQLASGHFVCRNICSRSVVIHQKHIKDDNIDRIASIIRKQKKNIIVINDSDNIDFIKAKNKINSAFNDILFEKSSFEN